MVRVALDEFDDRPLSTTVRRVVRIAMLLGEHDLALRLGFELKPMAGHPPTNAEDTRRLMSDPSTWGDPDSEVEHALKAYMEHRKVGEGTEGKFYAHSLDDLEDLVSWGRHELERTVEFKQSAMQMSAILSRIRHSCFAALCAWERRLTYADTNERIFDRFRSDVDAMLATGAPALLDQFNAVYRRLRDGAASGSGVGASEDLTHALTTCRRILKAVADHVMPGVQGAETPDGHRLDDQAYRNRIHEYVKSAVGSDRTADAVKTALGGVIERFNALDQLASKGVHAGVALAEAELCAINTYIVAGELLRISADAAADFRRHLPSDV